jgi:hypothetical protein
MTLILPAALGPGVYSASNRNRKIIMFLESKVRRGRRANNLTAICEPIVLNCTHEAERTPFQTHYLSENLVAPGIEPGPLDL